MGDLAFYCDALPSKEWTAYDSSTLVGVDSKLTVHCVFS